MNDAEAQEQEEAKFTWELANKFWQLVKPYWTQEKRRQAWGLLILLILFTVLLAGVNAYKTYISKWAIDTLTEKDKHGFYQVILLAVVSLAASVPVQALKLFYESKLALYWRLWFNLDLLKRYFNRSAYYKMSLFSKVDNPDQRIAEDLNNFVIDSSHFFSILLLSIISVLTYIGVLGFISVWLVLVVFLYATIGTSIIVWISKKLVLLNFRNIKYQANYRYNLVHVRDNIESIAFYQGEKHEGGVLKKAFHQLIDNYRNLIILERNISFFSEAYILFSALVPYLVLAPSMFRGEIQVGTVVQASTVFAILLNDLSIVISEFKILSTLAATVQRLSGFVNGLDVTGPKSTKVKHQIKDNFEFNDVTVRTPDLKKTLVTDLNLSVKPNTGLMIVGPSGCGKSSLLRAIAGLWKNGSGELTIPNRKDIMFLPQKPYMLIGSLREQLVYPHLNTEIDDETLKEALSTVGLEDLVERVGGLDAKLSWADLLSVGEQQRVIFLRLFLTHPKFAILDESSSALDEKNETSVYTRLRDSEMTYISVGHRSTLIEHHDNILEMKTDGTWRLFSQKAYVEHRKKQA